MVYEVKPIVYAEEYHDDKPSIFRESENLDRLLQAIFDVCYQQQLDFLWLSQNLLNVDVAEKAHLDFIGNIVGQPRFLSDFNTEPYFGYEGSYQSKPFSSVTNPDIGGFWNSRSHFNTATARQLNDDEYRRLIKARAIYNQSNCTANDLLEVVNLITDSDDNTVQLLKHGLIQIKTSDKTGILSYFVDRLYLEDNILPIAAGVRVGLEQSVREGSGGDGDTGDTGGDGGTVANKYVLTDYVSAGTYTLDAQDIILSVRINGEKITRRIPASLFEADGGFSADEAFMIICDVLGIPTEGLFYYMQGMRDGFFDDTSMKYRFSISAGGFLEPPYYSEEQLSGNPEDLLIEGFDRTGFDKHLSLLEMVMGQPIPSENKPIWNPESYEIEIFPTPYDELPSMTLDFISIINEMVGSEINSINLKSEGWIDYTPLEPFLS